MYVEACSCYCKTLRVSHFSDTRKQCMTLPEFFNRMFFLCFFFVDRYGYQEMVEISLRKSTDLRRSPEQCVHPSLQPVTTMTLEFGQFWHVTILTIPSCVLAKQVNIEFFEWIEIFYTGPFTYLTGLTESNGRLLRAGLTNVGALFGKNVWGPLPPIPSSRGSKVKWSIHLTWINDPRPFCSTTTFVY